MMRVHFWNIVWCGLAAALLCGCEAYVHTDAPPPSRIEVQPANPLARVDVDVKPAAPARPSVDVDVNTKPGGVDVNVNRNP
jgi:hypothetical protein